MKRFKLSAFVVGCLAILMLLGSFAYFQTQTAVAEPTTLGKPSVDVAQRIYQLPQDGHKYYLTIVLPENWQTDYKAAQVPSWFATTESLYNLQKQTHCNVYVVSEPFYRLRYQRFFGNKLAVVLTDDTGKVLYKVSGENVPGDPYSLAGEIDSCLVKTFGKVAQSDAEKIFPLRPRPRPCPGPGPCPAPEPEPKPVVDVDVQTQIPDKKPEPGIPVWVAVVVALGCFGAAAWYKSSKKYGGGL